LYARRLAIELGLFEETAFDQPQLVPLSLAGYQQAILQTPSHKLGYRSSPYLSKGHRLLSVWSDHPLIFLVFLKPEPDQ
jgi:hypothetical protein